MKTVFRVLFAIVLACCAMPADAAGLQSATVAAPGGQHIDASIWFPSRVAPARRDFGPFHPTIALGAPISGGHLPLVVFSHGTGGSALSHYDTAIALANAGYVVVTFDQPGDNYRDQSSAGFRHDLVERPEDVRVVLDYMLYEWPLRSHLDRTRVGIFGYSLGGFTALVNIGGLPNLRRMISLCARHPGAPECGFVRSHHGDQLDTGSFAAPTWVHDARIKAAVVVAPAASVVFGPGSLRRVRVPVQLWIAADDRMALARWNSSLVRRGLPNAPQSHVVAGAGHFTFLTPDICSQAPPEGCTTFHRAFNAAVVRFFEATLRPSRT